MTVQHITPPFHCETCFGNGCLTMRYSLQYHYRYSGNVWEWQFPCLKSAEEHIKIVTPFLDPNEPLPTITELDNQQ